MTSCDRDPSQAREGDVQIVVVVEKADLGWLGRRLRRTGQALEEIGGRHGPLPYRLVQPAIEGDGLGDAKRREHARQMRGGVINRVVRRGVVLGERRGDRYSAEE